MPPNGAGFRGNQWLPLPLGEGWGEGRYPSNLVSVECPGTALTLRPLPVGEGTIGCPGDHFSVRHPSLSGEGPGERFVPSQGLDRGDGGAVVDGTASDEVYGVVEDGLQYLQALHHRFGAARKVDDEDVPSCSSLGT